MLQDQSWQFSKNVNFRTKFRPNVAGGRGQIESRDQKEHTGGKKTKIDIGVTASFCWIRAGLSAWVAPRSKNRAPVERVPEAQRGHRIPDSGSGGEGFAPCFSKFFQNHPKSTKYFPNSLNSF